MRLWDAASGACLAASAGHAGAVAALAFARRGGGFLVSGGADRLLKVRCVSVGLGLWVRRGGGVLVCGNADRLLKAVSISWHAASGTVASAVTSFDAAVSGIQGALATKV